MPCLVSYSVSPAKKKPTGVLRVTSLLVFLLKLGQSVRVLLLPISVESCVIKSGRVLLIVISTAWDQQIQVSSGADSHKNFCLAALDIVPLHGSIRPSCILIVCACLLINILLLS